MTTKKLKAVPSLPSHIKNVRSKEKHDEDISIVSRVARELQVAYSQSRSDFESVRCGRSVVYRPPSCYDGIPASIYEDGTVATKGKESVWDRLARVCVAQKIDPFLFMQSQFDIIDVTARIPEPAALVKREGGVDRIADAARERFLRVKKQKGKEIKSALATQTQIATTKITILQRLAGESPDDSYAICLVDPSLGLSALFRYLVAKSIGGIRFQKIADYFEADASIEYVRFKQHYRRHWKKLLSSALEKRLKLVYSFLQGPIHVVTKKGSVPSRRCRPDKA